MPGVSAELMRQAGLSHDEVSFLSDELIAKASLPYTLVESGRKIGVAEPIFVKITDHKIEELRHRFAGTQQEQHESKGSASSSSSTTSTSEKKDRKEKKDKKQKKEKKEETV